MRAGFEAATLKPFPVKTSAIYGLPDAVQAYRRVIGGDGERIVLRP